MSYINSYSTAPQEKAKEIKEFIDEEYGHLVSTRIQRNPHDMGSYISCEVYWDNQEEYNDLEDADDFDFKSQEDQDRYWKLDEELRKLHEMEDEIKEKGQREHG